MAGDWIKVEHALINKPEVVALSIDSGLSQEEVTGRLIRMWCWFDAHTVDGVATRIDAATLCRLLYGKGDDAKDWSVALGRVGWLLDTDDGCMIPNFNRHTSRSAKERALGRERQRRFREHGGDADSVTREENRRD